MVRYDAVQCCRLSDSYDHTFTVNFTILTGVECSVMTVEIVGQKVLIILLCPLDLFLIFCLINFKPIRLAWNQWSMDYEQIPSSLKNS